MGLCIMVRQTKGHLIGQTANARRLVRRQIARRMGQDQPLANKARPIARIDDVQIGQLRQRARGIGQRALERFNGRFRFIVRHGSST